MAPIKIVVNGALGKMGREMTAALCREPDMKIVGAVDVKAAGSSLPIPDDSGEIPLSTDLEDILIRSKPAVVLDFSTANAVMPVVRIAAKSRVNLVIGTTGLSADDVNEIGRLATANKIGGVVAANFALGAVLMMHLAKIAAKYLDYAEIIELHHHLKADAPSGTALATAKAMAQAKGKKFIEPPSNEQEFPSRGNCVEGISIHSVRLPGLLAHQEVILGTLGQTLTIRHDTISRECYVPGVVLAIKKVVKHQGLIYGLDALLGL